MSKVIVSEFISADGVVENPAWTFQFGCDEQMSFKFNELKNAGALLLGRVTYEGFAASWPNMIEQTGDYGVWMNNYPKYVVSNTLTEAAWTNSHVIKGDLAAEVGRLKAEVDKDILVFGSGTLVKSLVALGLVDEFRLMTFPIILGKGAKLFDDTVGEHKLKLVKTDVFPTGTTVLTYEPA